MEEKTVVTQGMNQVAHIASNLFHTVKTAVQDGAQTLVTQFKTYKGNLLELAVYAGAFFVIGFLFKRYIKYIIFLAVFIAGLIILEQFDILHTTINWAKMQELLNVQPMNEPLNMQTAGSFATWAKANMAIVVTAAVGFVIGLKVG